MKKLSVAALVLLALVLGVVAFMYFSKTAGNLPQFLPGYSQGSDHTHVKHGIVFAGLAVVTLLGAWMLSGQAEDPVAAKKHVISE